MTNIEWVKNPDGTQGITVNAKTGCKNHTPEGLCLGGLFPCYARKLANTRLKQRYLANGLVACDYDGGEEGSDADLKAAFADPFYPRFWSERLEKIRKLKKPTGIFLDDMSDWMGDYWPEEWTRQELQVMRDCPQHRFYTLTKQSQRLPEFSPFPENVYVGVTATNQQAFLEAIQIFIHYRIKAKVRYISFEPLLSQIIFPTAIDQVDWLIIGACTGNLPDMTLLGEKYPDLWLARDGNKITAQPRIENLKEIVEAADKAGVKVFLKDNLEPLLKWPDSGAWAFAEFSNKLRQEMPE